MTELPFDAFYDLTTIGEVAVSPSGDRVAFTATEYDQERDESITSLFVVPTDGARKPHRLTSVSGASSPQWGPNGDRLAFLAARDEDTEQRVGWTDRDEDEDEEAADDEADGDAADSETGEDEEPKSQVWLFDLALGGDARQITDRDEGVSEFDWSPDGDRLVVAARDPTEEQEEYLDQQRDGGPVEITRMQHKLDGVGWTDDVQTYLFVVDLDDPDAEPRRLDDAYGGGAFQDLSGMQPAWGETGRIAFTSCRLDDPDDTMVRDVYVVDPDASDASDGDLNGGEAERLTDQTLSWGAPSWRPDGTLGGVVSVPENWCIPSQVYVSRDAIGGSGRGDVDSEPVFDSITADLDRTVARGGEVHWVDGDVVTRIGDESRTRLVRATTDGNVERLFEAQGDDRALAGFDVSDDGSTAALVLSHPSDGADVYAVDVDDLDAVAEPESLTRLSDVNAELREEFPMPDVERVEWESDDWEIDGVVYHDPEIDLDDGPHPVVVAIHGGPISYDEPTFSFNHAALTSRGYVVFRPNYRGGSSRGREFSEVLRGKWGTAEVADVAAGVRDLIDRGWADPDRVFGYGFSYGGITQGYLVTQEPDLLTAAAPEHGIYDLRSAFGTDDSHNWMENEYGLPWENPDDIDDSTAILDAGNIRTPLLVTAGGEDWRCPPSQSEQLYLAAKKQGVDAKLVVYPDEHHNIGDPDRAIHRLREVAGWYEKHDPEIAAADETEEQ